MEEVALAFESEKTCAHIREILEGTGMASCLLCHSGAEVKRVVDIQGISTVICGCKLRDLDAESLFVDLPTGCSMLVVGKRPMLDVIENEEIIKLAAPASRDDLLSAVRLLLRGERRVKRNAVPVRSAEEKICIERAKELLISRYGMSEGQAHRFLQKKSMDSGVKMLHTAQKILEESGRF